VSRHRFTIAALMAIVLFVAVGFAALRNANAFWASATFSLAVVTVSVAFAGAFARTGAARTPWAGFATCGFACLVIWLSTPETVGYVSGPPRLSAFWGFRQLLPYINPTAQKGGEPYIHWVQVCNSLQVVLFGLVGAILGRLVADPGETGRVE
jgi:hypothetical protein